MKGFVKTSLSTQTTCFRLTCLGCLCCLFIACSTISCPVQNVVAVNYGIHDADDAETKLSDTLWIWTPRSDGSDTLLLNRGVGLSSFSLPVSYAHPEDTLVFLLADTLGLWALDTVWVKKNDVPHFESVDCSAHYFHHLTNVRSTHMGIDTIKINNPSVTYDQNTTHLFIRFKSRQ